jgi:hypothetical protein
MGDATLRSVTISHNFGSAEGDGVGGGGILNAGTMTLSNSTVSDNGSADGGGIFNTGTLTVTNSTISSNTGGVGGIFNQATLTLANSTIAANRYGGLASFNFGSVFPVHVKNSIIAENGASTTSDCFSMSGIASDGYNLIGTSDDCKWNAATGDQVGTIAMPVYPQLGPLHENGGATFTHALLSGSPAIDAGSPDCPPPSADQRGVTRPQGAACDIGAYEFAPTRCVGDCDRSGAVTVDEIVRSVDIALGNSALSGCPAIDGNNDGQVTVDELVVAVNNALNGCSASP